MSSAGQASVRQAAVAINENDVEAFRACVTEDFEWVTATACGVEKRTYRGRDAMVAFHQDAKLTWATIDIRVDDVRDYGDRALVLGGIRRRSRRGGFEVTDPLMAVARYEGEKMKRFERFDNLDEALADLAALS